MFTAFARPSILRASFKALPVLIGSSVLLRPRPIVHNDVAISAPQRQYAPLSIQAKVNTSRFNGKLDYGELCFGSLTGLFFGFLVGKLSTAIVFLSVSTYLMLQFLENRGVISIPWTSVFTLGNRQFDLKTLFFNKPSFKFSFLSSFLIAAFNA